MDKIDIIYQKVISIEKDVKNLTEFKNKVVGAGIGLSAMFGFIFAAIRDYFTFGGRQ